MVQTKVSVMTMEREAGLGPGLSLDVVLTSLDCLEVGINISIS
jgi:hypothetical protein